MLLRKFDGSELGYRTDLLTAVSSFINWHIYFDGYHVWQRAKAQLVMVENLLAWFWPTRGCKCSWALGLTRLDHPRFQLANCGQCVA